MVNIIKASGEITKFDKGKIKKTVIKAGASETLAEQIATKIGKSVKPGTTTKQILDKTLGLLKENPEIAARYDLKRAIMMLGPHGFSFEEYFAQILQAYGYKTKVDVEIKGKVVMQEVDVVAQDKKTYMIEAKYHNSLGIKTNTKVAMYTYARFLDIKDNPKYKFNQPWLVTNTKCTHRAMRYSKGVGQKVISWTHPPKESLQDLIKGKGLYPITILKDLSNEVKERLFNAKIIIAKDLANHDLDELKKKTRLSEEVLSKILRDAKIVCGNF